MSRSELSKVKLGFAFMLAFGTVDRGAASHSASDSDRWHCEAFRVESEHGDQLFKVEENLCFPKGDVDFSVSEKCLDSSKAGLGECGPLKRLAKIGEGKLKGESGVPWGITACRELGGFVDFPAVVSAERKMEAAPAPEMLSRCIFPDENTFLSLPVIEGYFSRNFQAPPKTVDPLHFP